MGGARWVTFRVAVGAAVLGLLVWRLGGGPFRTGLRSVDAASLALATALTVGTTGCSAWRWCLVARRLGIELPFPTAVAAYYRSQFLNSALPGGVLGDVHRGIANGRDARDVSRGLRAVAWERTAGQAVQLVLTALVLIGLASPVHDAMPAVLGGAGLAAVIVVLALRRLPATGGSRWARAVRTTSADLRAIRPAGVGIALTSVGVVLGHVAVFVVAARAVGVDVSLARLAPLTLLVLLATSVPLNIGGWGAREGAAAWAFGAAGLGAQQGVAVATAFGVLAFVATLPGALVALSGRVDRLRPAGPRISRSLAVSNLGGAAHG